MPAERISSTWVQLSGVSCSSGLRQVSASPVMTSGSRSMKPAVRKKVAVIPRAHSRGSAWVWLSA